MKSVRISAKSARVCLDILVPSQWTNAAIRELEAALSKTKRLSEKKRPSLKAKKERQLTKKGRSQFLRAALIERSEGKCELPHLSWHRGVDPHHALGRKGLDEGPHNCLWVCRSCHEKLTNPGEDAPMWFRVQANAFEYFGHTTTAGELRKKAAWAERKIESRSEMTRRAADG